MMQRKAFFYNENDARCNARAFATEIEANSALSFSM